MPKTKLASLGPRLVVPSTAIQMLDRIKNAKQIWKSEKAPPGQAGVLLVAAPGVTAIGCGQQCLMRSN